MMSEQLESRTQQHTRGGGDEDEIHLLDLLIILVRHKKLVIGTPIITGLIAMAISMVMTPIFTSTAKIMPPQQQSSGVAAVLGQLGGLAGAASSVAGIKNPSDIYVGILESRSVADRLIQQFNLQERYKTRTMDETRIALANSREISSGKKDGLISITVRDKGPKFAADLANAYVDELEKLTQTMAISEASKRRLFFERQLKEAKDQLADAEVALRNTQERTGMIQPEGQVQAIISTIAQLKGTIAAKEVQLNAMRTFATGQNPELLRAQEELRGLREQLAKLERNQSAKGGDFMVPAGKIPEAGIEYLRSFRNVKYYETIFEMLAKQYELAKVEEAKDSSLIQLLDKAVPAEKRTAPKRHVITLVGFLAGGLLGIVLALILEFYRRSRQALESNGRWEELSMAWKKF